MWTSQSSCNSPVKWDTTTSATSTSSTVSTSFTCLLMFVVFFVILLGVVGVLVVIVVIAVVVGVLVLVHDVVVVDIIYMYILYIYYIYIYIYIYICVCMYEHFQKHEHKTSHWHDTHIQGISNLHDPYYIFFLKTEFRLCLLRWKERSGEEGPIFSLRKMSELRCLDSTTPRGQRPETIEATAVILMQTVKYGERWWNSKS